MSPVPGLPSPSAPGFMLSEAQFRHLAGLVQRNFGIHLTDEKRMMLSMRMQKMMRVSGCEDFELYYRDHLQAPSAETLSELINHVSTNHTHFWREPEHFELYREQLLPEALRYREQRGKRDLRVWCAAASTGEEPYTLAMLQREVLGHQHGSWRAGLLATDISLDALSKAREGLYHADNVARLPAPLRKRYMRDAGPGRVTVTDTLKDDVLYRRLNLIQATLPLRGDLDVIFCRNVMIYFDEPTKRGVVMQMHRLLRRGGHLLIGHAETLNNLGSPFVFVRPGVYRRD